MRLREMVTGASFDPDAGSPGTNRAPPPGGLRTARDGPVVWVFLGGETYRIERVAIRSAAEPAAGEDDLLAPMPGKVRAILVAEGDAVTRGTTLLLLEAMKMEHPVRSPRDGVVRRLRVAEGAMVSAGERLVELE